MCVLVGGGGWRGGGVEGGVSFKTKREGGESVLPHRPRQSEFLRGGGGVDGKKNIISSLGERAAGVGVGGFGG